MIRYWLLIAVRSRALLAPVAAVAFVLAGVYAYKPNEPAPTWALTALLACPLCAWLVAAAAHAEPAAAREMRVAALGGHRVAFRAEVRAAATLGAILAALMIAYPLAIRAFAPAADAAGIGSSLLAHLACAVAGGGLGLLAGTLSPGAAAALVVGTMLAVVAAEPVLGVVTGPAGVAGALSDERAAALVAASLASLAWAGAAAALAARRQAMR